jgi:type I restriction enzyme S subunit
LDELLAAEGQKLEALRAHKKGLMQRLFPRPGESRPRLRFPEFRDKPQWSEKTLGTEGEFLTSLSGKTAADFDSGRAFFIPYSNVFENTFIDNAALRHVNVDSEENQNAVRKGDLFFTVSSETQRDAGMSSVLLQDIGNCYLNSFCTLFRFHDDHKLNSHFAGYLFRSQSVRNYLEANAQGAIRYNISRHVFRNLAFLAPSHAEQDAIADCLSSLDALIVAASRNLDALRAHKRGLMQQLFPLPKGV